MAGDRAPCIIRRILRRADDLTNMEVWKIYSKKADFAGISKQFQITPLLARILRNRDIEGPEQIRKYLHADVSDLYDPFLMKGMEEGVRITHDTIQNGGRIRIMGDYDTDGVCASYILEQFLTAAGAHADVRLPDRMSEGYGMSTVMAEEANENKISLIITCDNGISSFDAVEAARKYGIDVVVTDHHEPTENLPNANVIIDAKQKDCSYPFRELCGAGVAYKFVQAYNRLFQTGLDDLLDDLLQYAGIATIADIVPLKDENRIFASEGIRRLRNTNSPGLLALAQERGMDMSLMDSRSIAYILSPCINSAGRLKNAGLAYELLCEKDPQKARMLAKELSELNEQRKTMTSACEREAIEMIRQKEQAGPSQDSILVVFLPMAHESIAGILAGRLKDEYNRPAIVITRSQNALKGSGRSIDSYNLIEGLREHPELFEKCGGHAKACGFTLKSAGTDEETVSRFAKCLNASCRQDLADLERVVWIDMALPFKYINEVFTKELDLLEPFGTDNEKPVFGQNKVTVLRKSILGRNRNVLKLSLQDESGFVADGIMFGQEDHIRQQYEKLEDGSLISILYYPMINEFRGNTTPQAVISAFRIME